MSDISYSKRQRLCWTKTRFLNSVADGRAFPYAGKPQVAVAGHSNVGKSSLLNALFGRKGLAKTSKSPGCTRLLNVFDVDGFLLLIDLPGYGFARASKHEQRAWSGLIENYLLDNPDLKLVLSLLDIRHGPKKNDLQLIEWLNAAGLRWLPVATKADKLSGNARSKRLKEMTKALGGMLTPLATSANDGRGIEELRHLIEREVFAAF
ncbi:MAG: YihA family ribosome biogenesis GTP-binding protein [Zetaproteobacteria bacterium]|nr:MAG: YihA family ribosome biogenesis GTP-binding protein [Zetaproteobacteria bacterium]